MNENGIIPLCGLWENTTKTGAKYLAGNLGGVKVMIFKNDFKREDSNDPDCTICIVKKTQNTAYPQPNDTKDSVAETNTEIKNDDIPF